jgi:hypothetical protein
MIVFGEPTDAVLQPGDRITPPVGERRRRDQPVGEVRQEGDPLVAVQQIHTGSQTVVGKPRPTLPSGDDRVGDRQECPVEPGVRTGGGCGLASCLAVPVCLQGP